MTHVFKLHAQRLHLHPLRTIFWEEKKALLLADLHLGKVDYFAANGIPIPPAAGLATLENLSTVIDYFSPERVIILGDLFHSDLNSDWDRLTHLMASSPNIDWHLVLGNHDVFHSSFYRQSGFIVSDSLQLKPFTLMHHPIEGSDITGYQLAGHVHPCVIMKGPAKQRLRLACYYFGEHQGILPAFGVFTGKHEIVKKTNDRIFVIANEKVIPVI